MRSVGGVILEKVVARRTIFGPVVAILGAGGAAHLMGLHHTPACTPDGVEVIFAAKGTPLWAKSIAEGARSSG